MQNWILYKTRGIVYTKTKYFMEAGAKSMFGYVTIYKPEMKIKDFSTYRAYYCGLCRMLKKKYGISGQMTLTYDMTFLILLLTSLYECPTKKAICRCGVHPVQKKEILINEITEYGADMNIALSYHHFVDDWKDEHKKKAMVGIRSFHRRYEKVKSRYPKKCAQIERCLRELSDLEREGEQNLDKVSGSFGKLMEELMVYRRDVWEEELRKTGFYLGKFIYLMDAYEDLEKDRKQHNYNPLLRVSGEEQFEEKCCEMLTMMMAECTEHFEKLPCVENIEILRNILYAGVWNRYQTIRKKKSIEKKEENRDDK